MLTELLKYFIPHKQVQAKNRTYLVWERGNESVEVQIPGFKIGKRKVPEKRSWIVATFIYPHKLKNGRVVYKRITSSYVYNKEQLESLLNELNRPH